MFDWAKPVSKKGNNFGCVYDPKHYGIYFVHWEMPYRIEQETVMIQDSSHEYEILQTSHYIGKPLVGTRIRMWDIDAEGRVIESSDFKDFNFNKPLFDFAKANKEKLLNRIKTILVFQ
jgi:hypothetical protein